MTRLLDAFTTRARTVSFLLSLAVALAVISTANASAAPSYQEHHEQMRDTTISAEISAQAAVYRGSYWIHPDCDLAGFIGVMYGLWRGYVCMFNTRTRLWDLYA